MSLNTDVHSVRRRFWVYAVLFLATVGLAGWVRAQESGARDRIYAVSHVDVVPTDAAAGTKLLQQYVEIFAMQQAWMRQHAVACLLNSL